MDDGRKWSRSLALLLDCPEPAVLKSCFWDRNVARQVEDGCRAPGGYERMNNGRKILKAPVCLHFRGLLVGDGIYSQRWRRDDRWKACVDDNPFRLLLH